MKPSSSRDVARLLRSRGWEPVRVKGSHEMWVGPAGETLSVPRHGEVSAGVVRQILGQISDPPAEWK